MSAGAEDVGIVVVGRNEGERLRRCLESAGASGGVRVYVDSGSSDGSPALARAMGWDVVELDPARPFSAARARNEGFARARARKPDLRYVQFVDADASLQPGWIEAGTRALEDRPGACAAVGRLRELHPEASVYNRIADASWRMPLGEVPYFGGIALLRAEPFAAAGGFDASVPAGEEPELAQRLRRAGGTILSIDADMALHDAAILRFGQWWRRSVRTGQAYAQVCWLGRGLRGRLGLLPSLRAWAWGLAVPLGVPLSALLHPLAPAGALLLLLLQAARVGWGLRRRGVPGRGAFAYAALWPAGQAAQALGQLRFLAAGLRRRPPTLLEYKDARVPADADAARVGMIGRDRTP